MRTLCVGWAFDCPPKADHFCSVGGYSTPFKPTQFKVGQRVRVDLGTGDYVRAGDNQPFFATVLAVEEEHVWVKRVDLSRAKARRICNSDCSPSNSFENGILGERQRLTNLPRSTRKRLEAAAESKA